MKGESQTVEKKSLSAITGGKADFEGIARECVGFANARGGHLHIGIEEAKAIIQRGLGADATDEAVAQIYNVTEGVYRHIEMILPRIIELKSKNHHELGEGTVKMQAIINTAGSRLMI